MRRGFLVSISLAFAAWLLPLRAEALTLERVGGASWDFMRHVALRDGVVLRTTRDTSGGGKLIIQDFTDPARPELLAAFNLGHYASILAASESLAVAGGWGLRVVDITDPWSPVDHGTSLVSRDPFDLALLGDTLYVADHNEGLLVVDLSDPASPSVMGTCPMPAKTRLVGAAGDAAVVCDWYHRVHVVDVSDPGAPAERGVWQSGAPIADVAMSGQYAFVVAEAELRVLDVATPSAPNEVAVYAFDREASGIALAGDSAFVMFQQPGGIMALDISEPASPVLEAYFPVEWPGRDLATSDSQAVAIGGEGQILAVDVATLEEAYRVPRMSVAVGGYDDRVATAGGRAYVAGPREVSVVDVRYPEAPVKVGSLEFGSSVRSVIASEGLMYVLTAGELTAGEMMLSIYDISEPDWPERLGGISFASREGDFALQGDLAYVCDGVHVRVVDVSDPTAPVEVGSFGPMEHGALSVAGAGEYAYVGTGGAELLVLDVSDPGQPTQVGKVTGLPTWALATFGALVFAARGDYGVRVISARDPAAPVEVAVLDLPATEVAVWGRYVFTDAGFAGFSDILIGATRDPQAVTSSCYAFAGDYVYRATGDSGLVVYLARTTFTDTPLDYWALDAIERCAAWGIVGGYPDGSYRSEVAVSRDQMAVYISRGLAGGDEAVPTGPAAAHFPDVPTDHWAYRYVEYAYENGVVEGYPDGLYRPGVVLDRGQMAVFIARAMAGGEAWVPDPGCTEPVFPDIPCEFWARKHIQYIKAAGVTEGYADGRYHPEYVCDRGLMAVFVTRGFRLPM